MVAPSLTSNAINALASLLHVVTHTKSERGMQVHCVGEARKGGHHCSILGSAVEYFISALFLYFLQVHPYWK